MNTYDSEKRELFEWLQKKTAEYDAAWEKQFEEHGVQGRDSELTRKHQLDVQEYNRRFQELKKKYGIE